ncbi:uncharacterized protein involved in exopolysaccharide biosynthesis [Bradyrhizobium sp. i1.8.4]|uniref:Wzz/FepE/Etk N-terminal domain-containing protein n=1 Tax=unclassified Bradyrhizobium TaxID=2631580 RepID=UPI003D19BB93
MLHTYRPDSSPNQDHAPSDLSPAELLAEAVAFLRRRIWIILLTCSVTLVVAVLYLIAAVPTFTASAELIVASKAASADLASISTNVESQIAIIKSEGVARAVIQKLSLAEDPEFAGGGLIRRVGKSASRLLGWSKPETDASVTRSAVESFERKLAAKRLGLTYIVGLTFDSADPDRATLILNTIVETYITSQMDAKYRTAVQSEKWAKDRVNELSSQASAARKALADYNNNRNESAASTVTSTSSVQSTGELRELEAAAESSARAYDNFLRTLRYMEATQQQSAPVFEARLLTEVSRPFTASSPKVRVVLGIGIVGGLLLGIAIGLLRDLSERGPVPVRRSGGAVSGGTGVNQGLKVNGVKSHFDGSFKAEKHHAYNEAAPD